MSVRIALSQYSIQPGDTVNNYNTAVSTIHEAARQGCHLVQLPELWLSGYDLANCWQHSQAAIQYQSDLQNLADSLNIAIGGSVLTCSERRYFNTYQLFQPGKILPAEYRKTHLFQLLDEQKYLTPGDQLTTVDLPWGRVGLILCYDLRFPELVRAYVDRGIDCLLVAAEWGQKRSEHWRILLKARAIENQIFVAATNAMGPIYENQLAGYSAVIDPWGNVLAEAEPDEPVVLVAEMDLSEIVRVRQMVPSISDRQPTLYQRWNDELL